MFLIFISHFFICHCRVKEGKQLLVYLEVFPLWSWKLWGRSMPSWCCLVWLLGINGAMRFWLHPGSLFPSKVGNNASISGLLPIHLVIPAVACVFPTVLIVCHAVTIDKWQKSCATVFIEGFLHQKNKHHQISSCEILRLDLIRRLFCGILCFQYPSNC